MQIKFKTLGEWLDERKDWKLWFAWHPICISNSIVWLETVKRKVVTSTNYCDGFTWQYVYSKNDQRSRRQEVMK